MYTCHLIVLLLVFWFQSICGNQNAVFDKNYSDRLTEPNNQHSSLQQINTAYHATVSSDPNHFTVQATEPSIKSQTPHHVSNVNCLKRTFIFVCSLLLLSLIFWIQNNISHKYCLIWTTEFIKSKDRNNRISFGFFFYSTLFQTRTIFIIGSWQLITNMRMKDFDVAVVMTGAAAAPAALAVQKLDQLWIVVLCPGTVTTTPSYQ